MARQVLFFCSFPPPYTGQAVATEIFFRLLPAEVDAARINIVDPRRHVRTNGAFSLGYARELAGRVRALRGFVRRERPDVLYIVLAASALGHLRVLFLSNMIPEKGYEDLGRALGLLRHQGLPFEADFVGGWPSAEARAAFEALLAEEGLAGAVRVHGAVAERARLRTFLLDADAFVLPTYYPVEAQPLSIIEALNAATPVVSTRHASIPEFVHDGENGYLVAKRAPAEIAAALTRLAEPGDWRAKALAARATYEALFSPEAVKGALLRALFPEE